MTEPKEKTLNWITAEFLRRVVNELKGRQFEYREDHFVSVAPHAGDVVSGQAKEEDFLKVLPEFAREFAQKIDPTFTRCHKLQATYGKSTQLHGARSDRRFEHSLHSVVGPDS